MAIGAYSTGLITMAYRDPLLGFVLGLATGAVSAAMVGFLIGLPTLRLRGDYLAIATLGMAEIIRVLLLNMGFTNGAAGLSALQFVNWSWLFVLTVGTVVLITNFLNSRHGRTTSRFVKTRSRPNRSVCVPLASRHWPFMTGAFFVRYSLVGLRVLLLLPPLLRLHAIDQHLGHRRAGWSGPQFRLIAAVLLAIVSTPPQPFPEIRMILYSWTGRADAFRPQGIMGSRELSSGFSRPPPKRSKDSAATEGATA